jgi:Transposase DDE domain/Transposase domain (DUF772)
MITIRDRRTGDLFDRWSELGPKRRQLLERSWAGVFRQHLLEDLSACELRDGFDSHLGRPSKDLHVVMGVLILQQMHDLTDAATVEALAFNLAWHYALDIRAETDCYFCEKTLRNYRARVVAKGLDAILFRHLTDKLIRAFSVDTSHQRMESTALRSAMRSLTRLGIVVETISKFVRALERVHPALHARIDEQIIKRYVAREGEGCFASTTPSLSRRRLAETGPDLLGLVTQFRQTPAHSLPEFVILEQVLRDQFVPGDAEPGPATPTVIPRPPKDIPCDTIGNPADPDASYNAHKGMGYVAQIVETCTEDDGDDVGGTRACPDLITHVAVHKMTVHDGHRLPDALEDLAQRALTPERLLGDTHYGGPDNMALAAQNGVSLVAPICAARGKGQGKLTLEDFALGDDGRVERCPKGIAPVATSRSAAKLQARFDLTACRACSEIDRCPLKSAASQGDIGRFQYDPSRIETRAQRLYRQSDEFFAIYRWRAGIEATMSRLKHQMNLSRLRIRGMPAMRYVTRLRALGLNIFRCAAITRTGTLTVA